MGSYLDARAQDGRWLVRIEDLDAPRAQPGAAADILATLAAFGLHSDEPVVYQQQRGHHYRQALQRLEALGHCYPCACSRRDIRQLGAATGLPPGIYPGTCRDGLPPGRRARATRLRVPERAIGFHDRVQGRQEVWLPGEFGDFILKRADGLFAYQLAVVVDDALQGITHVVRGADLLNASAAQILLHELLGSSPPTYLHLPVAADPSGAKLSKQTHARAVDPGRAVPTLCQVMGFLGQRPPPGLQTAPLQDFWRWAITHWRVERVPATRLIRQH